MYLGEIVPSQDHSSNQNSFKQKQPQILELVLDICASSASD